MLFNSFEFAIFLPVTFLLYWFVFNKHLRLQNLFLVVCSYVFYGWWDWRFLSLIIISSVTDFIIGQCISTSKNLIHRKILLGISLSVNLGLLGFFKYYNFFIESLVESCSVFGFTPHVQSLNIILPVGISFYTFQTLSYTIDIYRKRLQATTDLVAFLAFVSFFPQLVAGPIERATNLLPQFMRSRKFDELAASTGLKLILWGLFKKIVIADVCAGHVDKIFANYTTLNSLTLFIGLIYFSFQIYGDFSGYSDIARGVAQLFGFELMKNFDCPYRAKNMHEFWKRWHISLSTWFRDYVYIPLGGNRCGAFRHFVNVMITFIVSGFWHGANWTFICWGALHGFYQLPFMLVKKAPQLIPSEASPPWFSVLWTLARIVLTFGLTTLAWTFFRSETVSDAFAYLFRMVSWNNFSGTLPGHVPGQFLRIVAVMLIEWGQQAKPAPLHFTKTPLAMRWSVYLLLVLWVLNAFVKQESFIYFQF